MKRLGNVWQTLISFENLYYAFKKARLGKSHRPEVAKFTLNLERELLSLRDELGNNRYKPGDYRLFTLYERKPRQIAAAPFRDRVVHHAILNVIEPVLDKRFIYDTYACRQHKGVHKAVQRYQQWSRQYAYVLKLDISRYFPSIDHAILRQKLTNRIKDTALSDLLANIIHHSPTFPADLYDPMPYFPGDDLFTPWERRKGIPIGNLTSQFFANLYLDDFDHHVKEQLKARAYLRYVDDMFFLSNDKNELHAIKKAALNI